MMVSEASEISGKVIFDCFQEERYLEKPFTAWIKSALTEPGGIKPEELMAALSHFIKDMGNEKVCQLIFFHERDIRK